jgi:hypothetical protein
MLAKQLKLPCTVAASCIAVLVAKSCQQAAVTTYVDAACSNDPEW